MTDSKPFASLSSSLLARKGNAKPAMRPQGFNDFANGFTGTLEDLGWNDMGAEDEYPHHHTATSLGLTPAPRGHGQEEPEALYEEEYEEGEDEPTQPLLAQKPHAQTSALPVPIESARNVAEPEHEDSGSFEAQAYESE